MESLPRRNSLNAYDFMDGVRAVAAVTVVISHVRSIVFIDAAQGMSLPWKIFYFVTNFGHQAVMVFFVLSGYWIAKSVSRRSMGEKFVWVDYGIDRLSRLWIVLIPAPLLGGLLDTVGRYGLTTRLYSGLQGTKDLTWDVATHLTLVDFAGNIMFLQNLLVGIFGSNGPLWSLANEFWYYVWFPPIYQIVFKRTVPLGATIISVMTMAIFWQLLPGFACWLMGAVLFFLTQSPGLAFPKGLTNAVFAITCVVFFAALCLSRIPNLPIASGLQDLLLSLCFALMLFVVIKSAKSFPYHFAPICRYGAGSSFSLYVVHFPLAVFLAALLVTPTHRLPPSVGLMLEFSSIGLITIIYAYVISTVTEANTSRLRRWLKTQFSRTQDKSAEQYE